MNRHIERGFSLIETMIVMVILTTIATLAYGSYQNQVTATKRSEGQAYLLELASLQEDFYNETFSYANSIEDINQLNAAVSSEHGYYTISIRALPAGCSAGQTACRTYVLTATANFNDTACSSLSYAHNGKKSSQGTSNPTQCWH